MELYLRSSLQAILVGSALAVLLSVTGVFPVAYLRPISGLLGLSNRSAVVQDTPRGLTYNGVSIKGVEHFYNIFYAEDTAGNNRFAPPVPLTPAFGSVLDNTAPGAVCPQGEGEAALPFTSPVTNTSENCLSLHVSRPAGLSADAKLPVMVWIHGGGSALGTATDKLYHPDGLIKQAKVNKQPVIFVGINYRLGIFGYATNKALRVAKSANVGLRDQRAAFEWVKGNIASFGGDPQRITAIGQSVGGSSIGLHLISHKGKQGVPFEKAIMMSGASGLNFNVMSDLVANNTATVATTMGCTDDFDSEATVQCLRTLPLKDLMEESVSLARKLRPPFGELSFYPSYDGYYIPDRPSELLKKGQYVKNIPLIASWVTNDGAWYPPPTVNDDPSVAASFATFVPGLSNDSQQRLLKAYPAEDFESLVRPEDPVGVHYYRAAQINRDMWFTCPVIDFTWHYARSGQTVRLYEFNQTRYAPVFKYMGVPFWRVAHLSDIPYVMNGEVAGGGDNSEAQIALAKAVSGSMAAFAHTGDPTQSSGEVLGNWLPAYEGTTKEKAKKMFPEKINVRVIGGPFDGGTASVSKISGDDSSERDNAVRLEKLFERCELFNSLQEEIGV